MSISDSDEVFRKVVKLDLRSPQPELRSAVHIDRWISELQHIRASIIEQRRTKNQQAKATEAMYREGEITAAEFYAFTEDMAAWKQRAEFVEGKTCARIAEAVATAKDLNRQIARDENAFVRAHLRRAIVAHRAAVSESEDEPAPWDVELWAALDEIDSIERRYREGAPMSRHKDNGFGAKEAKRRRALVRKAEAS